MKQRVTDLKRLRWDDLQVLLAIARSGTIRAASEETGLSPATLSRHVSSLEFCLGAKVLERLASGSVLTALGQSVVDSSEKIEGLANHISRMGDAYATNALTGAVRINANEWVSYLLMMSMSEFNNQYPHLSVEVLTSQQPYNLHRREADIALVATPPAEGDLYIRRIGTIRFGLYCSRQYYERRRMSIEERRWSDLSFIGYDNLRSEHPADRWLRALPGTPQTILRCSWALGIFDGIRGHSGLGVLANFVGDGDPSLVCVMPDIDELQEDVWLVLHGSLRTSARIRAIVNYVTELL